MSINYTNPGFVHSPGVAGGATPAALARPGDEEIVATIATSREGKTLVKNPAFKIAAELNFDSGGAGSALAAIAGEFEPDGEVRLHGAIANGTVGPATAIDCSAGRRAGGR